MKSDFKDRIYKLTQKIPMGKVATYGQLAVLSGSSKASRAVGMVLSQNIMPETIPCHRVVSSTGKLTGYAFGGVNKKKEILEKEGVSFIGNKVDLSISLWSGS